MSQTGQDGCLKLMKLPKRWLEKIVVKDLQENLKHFLNSEIGSVLWQLNYLRSVGETRGDK